MKILLLEDEKDLAQTGKEQLEQMGYEVLTAFDIAEARQLLAGEGCVVNVVIADHRLPDGLGIDFVIEVREHCPKTQFAIVSGVLTDRDTAKLELYDIPFYHKPLLYRTVMQDLRETMMKDCPVTEAVDAAPEESHSPVQGDGDRGGNRVPFWKRIFGGKE